MPPSGDSSNPPPFPSIPKTSGKENRRVFGAEEKLRILRHLEHLPRGTAKDYLHAMDLGEYQVQRWRRQLDHAMLEAFEAKRGPKGGVEGRVRKLAAEVRRLKQSLMEISESPGGPKKAGSGG